MKIKHLLIAAFACAALAACEKTPVENPGVDNGPRETNYLSIRIGDVPTRATGDFEYGTGNENKIESVRLYFFDADGNATDCVNNSGTYQNYFDFTTFTGTNSDANSKENVEKKLDAVVVISTAKGDKLPAMVAAVINVPTGVTVNASSVAELRANVANIANFGREDAFVMSSSAYLNGGIQDVVILAKDNFKSSADAAKAAPVQIYVERVLAKVRVDAGDPVENEDITLDGGRVLYYTGQTSDKSGVEAKKVYVEFLGWAATATADVSYLVKNLNTSWETTAPLTWNAWQNASLYRSYWALNPTSMKAQYYTYNEIKVKNTSFDASVPVYCQENAEGTQAKTKIIVAAQLVNANGEAVEISEWMGSRYAGDDIKLAMLVGLQSQSETIMIGEEPINVQHITFKTAGALEKAYGHEVYAQLTDAAATALGDGASTVNETLKNLGAVKYWNDGMTYYFTDILHYETNPGVVRNHIYSINITDVKGLGTPVYDPKGPGTDPDPEEIIPESPTDSDSYLAAQINILSWRLVEQNVSFGE